MYECAQCKKTGPLWKQLGVFALPTFFKQRFNANKGLVKFTVVLQIFADKLQSDQYKSTQLGIPKNSTHDFPTLHWIFFPENFAP